MVGTNVRLVLVCLLAVTAIACSDDPVLTRGNAPPGAACTTTNDCAVGLACEDSLCTHVEPFRITLSWTVDTDFDLHVRTPNGNELYFGDTNEQAYLGEDDCPDTRTPKGDTTVVLTKCLESEDGMHREHAFLLALPEADVDAGEDATDTTYEYWVDNYGCDTAGSFNLEVVAKDRTVRATESGELLAACVESRHFEFNPND